jgi:hypothetical protein
MCSLRTDRGIKGIHNLSILYLLIYIKYRKTYLPIEHSLFSIQQMIHVRTDSIAINFKIMMAITQQYLMVMEDGKSLNML